VKVSRRHGRLRLQLDPVEVALLESMFDELTTVAAAEDDGAADPVVQRLYPTAHPGDPAADAEYRALTQDSLRSERLARIQACAAELAAARDVDLGDADVAERWIKVLNDLRLALGVRLEITEDDDPLGDGSGVDETDQPRLIYHWLTAVQDTVVTALMG
jgi:hypothetical protein